MDDLFRGSSGNTKPAIVEPQSRIQANLNPRHLKVAVVSDSSHSFKLLAKLLCMVQFATAEAQIIDFP